MMQVTRPTRQHSMARGTGARSTGARGTGWFLVLTVGLLAFLVSQPAPAQKIGSKYDGEADFSGYHTFRWHFPDKPKGPRVSPGGDLDVVIRAEVVSALTAAGLEEGAEGTGGDLLVSYDAVATPALDEGALRREITPGVAWVMDGEIRSYLDGTLVITLTDTATDLPVWSGWVTTPIKNDKKLEKKVRRLTRKIMARFPPGS